MPRGKPARDEELLRDIRELADDLGHTPTSRDIQKEGSYCRSIYDQRFPTFAVAVTKAGLIPKPWNPLNRREISQWHESALSKKTDYTLTGIFFQFLPVKPSLFVDFDPAWLTSVADDSILQIPSDDTSRKDDIEIIVPDTWTDTHTNKEKSTFLPDLLDWGIAEHGSTPFDSINSIKYAHYKIASGVDFETSRPNSVRWEEPKVTARDLYHTHGIHLARNGASKEWIARRMGLNRPEQAEAYYAILEHHDKY
jgi:hypothetical protein